MTVLAIDHVQLAMPPGREADARAFYGTILGFDEVAKPAALAARGGVWFACGMVHVHLGIDDAFRPGEMAHAAFLVDDFEGLSARFGEAGIIGDRSTDHLGRARAYVRDPFGNRLEFIEGARP